MTNVPWVERPVEQARLLNPAFLGAILWCCARAYASAGAVNQPFALSFLVAPIVLHRSTRESLPGTTRTSLVAWLAANPKVLVGFPKRATSLVPFVKEALLFASGGGLIKVQDACIVAAGRPRTMAKFERDATDEVRSCIKKSEFIGKWFALSGDYATLMALWGVAP